MAGRFGFYEAGLIYPGTKQVSIGRASYCSVKLFFNLSIENIPAKKQSLQNGFNEASAGWYFVEATNQLAAQPYCREITILH
ncbi:hypothetical protein HRG84_11150 [Flavisolibacter sp. BT320]|nr:hypothetical protein [Flavisolibacter longurius]